MAAEKPLLPKELDDVRQQSQDVRAGKSAKQDQHLQTRSQTSFQSSRATRSQGTGPSYKGPSDPRRGTASSQRSLQATSHKARSSNAEYPRRGTTLHESSQRPLQGTSQHPRSPNADPRHWKGDQTPPRPPRTLMSHHASSLNKDNSTIPRDRLVSDGARPQTSRELAGHAEGSNVDQQEKMDTSEIERDPALEEIKRLEEELERTKQEANEHMAKGSQDKGIVAALSRRYEHLKQFVTDKKNAFLGKNSGTIGNISFLKNQITIQAVAETKALARTEDLKCSQPIITQPNEPTGEFMSGVQLEWSLPSPKNCDVVGLHILIRDNSGPVYGTPLKSKRTTFTIPDSRLRCGSKYYARIVSRVKHCDDEEELFYSRELTFFTRPGRPSGITLACSNEYAEVQWSTCEGAEKFGVSIYDGGIQRLDYKEVFGAVHKCTFAVDATRGIRLGKNYHIEVVSMREDWRNHSGKQKVFFGTNNSPKSVEASLVKDTNKVELKWKSPAWSLTGYTYIIEIVADGGEVREIPEIHSTSVVIDDLKGGMSYVFRVATIDGNNRSLWSTSNTIKTEACTIKVEKFRLEPNLKDPACSLDCVWDIVNDATGYKIKLKQQGKMSVVRVDATVTRYTFKDLLPNTEYQACIKARDGKGYGLYSDEDSKLTDFSSPKDPLVKVRDKNTVAVKFTPAQMATKHKIILHDNDGEVKEKEVDKEDAAEFLDLEFNTKYFASVVAIYGDKEGGQVISDTVTTAPNAPRKGDIHYELEESNPTSVFTLSTCIIENCVKYEARVFCLDHSDEDNVIEMEEMDAENRVVKRYKCYHEVK